MSLLTTTGFSITSLDARLSALQTLMQNIFGTDINLDPNSFDGQTLSMLAESINNLDQLAESVYNSFNPNTAVGNGLSLLVQLNYLTRQQGSYSTVPISITGTTGTVIPAGSVFQANDGSNNEWVTTAPATIDNTGTIITQAQASAYGPLYAPVGTVTVQLTPVYGVTSATNLTAASPGTLTETDEQLRVRRAQSTATNGVGSLDSIHGALLNVSGVTQAAVYENYTSTVNGNGQPANSVYAIVLGGADQDIWNTMWFKKPAGINVAGSHTGTVIDTAGWPHTMAFDRPVNTPVYVIANVKQRTGFPASGSNLIEAALVAWANANQTIGANVIQSELYAPLMSSINNTGSILSLYVGTSPTPTTTTDVTIAYNAIAVLSTANITVNLS